MRHRPAVLVLFATLVAHLPGALAAEPAKANPRNGDPILFDRDIRPLFSDTCFACHGPDEKKRKANLYLDSEEDIFKNRGGYAVVVPGELTKSELFRRLTTEDVDDRMPPAESDRQLTEEEIGRILRWIEQGAKWRGHWSFQRPERSPPPRVTDETWPRNALDAFILARLEKEGLRPSPQAEEHVLIRRATLDLTGVPPTPAEIDQYFSDGSPDGYERVVDRLLRSPRYGEHTAKAWLDVARYSDTNGYQIDNERYMWRWRDWVLEAFNGDMPFDQFTIEQLAGDLLPGATTSQKVATGFHRNHRINWEGGIIPEEFRVEYVADRVETTATVWLGLTLRCARCHNHKYDPITQREFYGLFAFFNNITEKGSDGQGGNSVPFIRAPARSAEEKLDDIGGKLVAAEKKLQELEGSGLAEEQALWEKRFAASSPLVDVAPGGTVTQSSTPDGWGGPELAIDGNPGTISHTVAGENLPSTLTLELAAKVRIQQIVLYNRDHPAASARLRDVTVSILDPSGTEVFTSDLLNPGNELGTANYEPRTLTVDLTSAPVSGSAVRIVRTPDGDSSGDDADVLTLSEVEVFATSSSATRSPSGAVVVTEGLVAHYKLDGSSRDSSTNRYHAKFKNGNAAYVEGFSGNAAVFDGKRFIEAKDTPDFERLDAFSFGAWIYPFSKTAGPIIAKLDDSKSLHGYDMFLDFTGRVYVHLSHHLGRSAIRVFTVKPLRFKEWHHVFATYDGTSSAEGLKIYVDGDVQQLKVEHDNLSGSIRTKEPLRIGSRQPSSRYRYTGRIDEVRLYDRTLSAEEVKILSSEPLIEIVGISPVKRTPQQAQMIRAAFLATGPPKEYKEARQQVVELRRRKRELKDAQPTTMVMQEGKKRDAFLLVRGEYDRRGEKVSAGVPACLPPLSDGAPRNRLGFARWLVDPANPLTPRVIMNRLWRNYFGTGIVKTVEDFGAQGERPSHPALLDWLASEFVRSGWNLRAMQRLIVTSATYRQSSKLSPALLERDPENRLLARGPRFRLSAEVIRDQALAIGGLLVEKLGGPSVKPYQPAGLWKDLTQGMGYSAQEYEEDRGENLYRRSLYTFWKRTVPPSTMATFDAPSREFCVVQRSRTNTPLQALALMNDVTYVEASRALAERVMLERSATTPEERLSLAFRLCTARRPTPQELKILLEGFRYHLDHFSELGEDSASNLVAVGDSSRDESLDARELAATTVLMGYILNLDETITKE